MSEPSRRPEHGRPGRPPAIDRDTIVHAALECLGPHRSLASLSLREVARTAGIAPNSFYRHFDSVEDMAVTLIEESGESLRRILAEARSRVGEQHSVIRMSTETFFARLDAEDFHLMLLLREGKVGPDRLRAAVERQLVFFEQELVGDLIRLTGGRADGVHEPALTARAITRLVFAMGARGLDTPPEGYAALIRETTEMVRMIVSGAQAMAAARRD